MPRLRTAVLGVLAVAGVTLANADARAATPLTALRYASDITAGLSGVTLSPAAIGEDDLAGTVALVPVGDLPPDAHIDAYQLLGDGYQLLSFDTTVTLPGGVTPGPADVVRFTGAGYVIVFAAAAAGVPEGVNVDAVAVDGADLLLSFDTSVTLNGTTFADEDLVRFASGSSQFTAYFIGAAAGVPEDLDLDGAQVLDAQHLLASFDGSGSIGGTAFNDDDVLEYDAGADAWEVIYRGVSHHQGWDPADLVALYALTAAPSATPTVTTGPSSTATTTATAAPTLTATATASGVADTPTPTVPGTSPTATVTASAPTATPPIASPTPTATPITPATTCLGDCNQSGEVTISELITMVNIALGSAPISNCPAGDGNNDQMIAINELVGAVSNALNGC